MATDNLGALQSLATSTATVTATALNLRNGAPLAKTLWANGRVVSVAGTAPTFAITLQGAPDGANYVTIYGPITHTAAATYSYPIKGNWTHVRQVGTITGTAPVIVHDCYISDTPSNPEG